MAIIHDNDIIYICNRIYVLRTQAHYSQEELAARLGICRVTLSRIESGQRKPTVAIILHLCDALHISISDILPPRVCGDTVLPSEYYALPKDSQAHVRTAINSIIDMATSMHHNHKS